MTGVTLWLEIIGQLFFDSNDWTKKIELMQQTNKNMIDFLTKVEFPPKSKNEKVYDVQYRYWRRLLKFRKCFEIQLCQAKMKFSKIGLKSVRGQSFTKMLKSMHVSYIFLSLFIGHVNLAIWHYCQKLGKLRSVKSK